MTLNSFTRRRWLAASVALALPAIGAETKPSARLRPLAVKSSFLDITLAGQRLVAVGERGHVLLSDDQGQRWRQARAVPTRAMLTALHAVDAKTLWAVGHGGVILHSTDAAETWKLVFGKAEGSDVLLSIRVEADGRGLAVGGFGLALASGDGGASWKRQELLAGDAGERHLNRIFTAGASTWLIAAEGGHVLRSEDRGDRWQAVKTPYAGSLWSGSAVPGGLLACGMRGNIVRSRDDGRTWTHQAIAGAGSLTAIALRPGGSSLVMVGVDGSVVTSKDGGATLASRQIEDRTTFTGAVYLASGAVAVASVAGLRVIKLDG